MYNNDDIFELMNYCHQKTKEARDGLDTYEDDSEADHEDGQYVGRRDAYHDIICKCANLIITRTPQL